MNDILFGNNNGAVIKKLSGRYFKASKSRNIIAIIAIVLTTILFTTIFTLGSGLMDTVHDQNIRKAGGDGQAVLNYISDEVYGDVAGNPLIDRIAYTKAVSYRLKNPGLERWRSDLWYMDDTALEFARYTPTTGHRPEAENEIIADTKTLDALGVPAQIGETVSLTYDIKGTEYTTDFTLCGFWETDSLSNIGRLIVSKAFVDAHSDILAYTYPIDNDYSGVVTAYVMFRGNGDIEAQLHQLLSETGYTCDTMGGSKEDSNYVIARVSPAYQSGVLSDNPAMLISGIVGVLLIIVTGYLIIYNIFQISVIQDIQSYGQLKTLGTTKRQIKRLINRQALRLSLIGIPVGLLIGFFIGRALVPFLMNGTSYTADAGIKVTVNPLIFIGSAAFALFTVFVSVRKPAKIAGTVSAIEAIRYTENDTAAFGKRKAKDKKSTHGAKLHFMALANLGRNRKRTVLVIVSMTLSLVLFNTVFTLSGGFDIDKYIAKFMDTDFVISTANYFQYQFEKSENDLSESFIEAVKQDECFEDGGRLYTSRTLEEPFSTEHNAFFSYNKDQNGNPFVRLYGADDFLLNGMEVIEGTIDLEKLKTGEYILLSVDCNDDGTVIENPNISVGDTVRINHLKAEELSTTITDSYNFIIMAKVRANENTATTRNTGESRFYLPTEIFLPLCDNPHLVSFPFDVKAGTETEMVAFLNSYIDNVEPSMDFESKETYVSSFDDLTSLIITIGGALSIIIGIIGIQDYYTYEMNVQGVTANTVIHRHANIRKALQYAVRTGLLDYNPADRVERPKKEQFSGSIYNDKELGQLFEITKGDPIELGVILAAFYGLRRSEVVGLRWDAIDFEQKTITIRHTVTQVSLNGKSTVISKDRTKTKSSYRTLPLVKPFEELLYRLKKQQEENRKLCGSAYCKKYMDYIYVNELGERIKPNYITQHFPLVLQKYGMRKIRFHDLRHPYVKYKAKFFYYFL